MPPSIQGVIQPIRTVLLICDVQAKFGTAIYGFPVMCHSIAKMTRAAAILGMPVIATEQHPASLGATVPEIGLDGLPDHLLLGTHAKTKFSMCIPPIQDKIKERNIDTAIIVGIESHICVLQSALDFLNDDLRVFVLADAVSSVHKQEIPLALETIKQAGGVVTTTESILFRLMGDASKSHFKPFVGLIKEEKANGNTKLALETFLDGSST